MRWFATFDDAPCQEAPWAVVSQGLVHLLPGHPLSITWTDDFLRCNRSFACKRPSSWWLTVGLGAACMMLAIAFNADVFLWVSCSFQKTGNRTREKSAAARKMSSSQTLLWAESERQRDQGALPREAAPYEIINTIVLSVGRGRIFLICHF